MFLEHNFYKHDFKMTFIPIFIESACFLDIYIFPRNYVFGERLDRHVTTRKF